MIGMPCKYACRAVELLHQHCAGHKMRPSGRTKGIKQVSCGAFFWAMAIGCAQHKPDLARAGIAPMFQCGGKFLRRKRLAAFIQKHCFTRALGCGHFSPAFRQFGQLHRPSQPFFIARNQLRFGGAGDFTAGYNVE